MATSFDATAASGAASLIPYSEDAIAAAFARRHSSDLRHVAAWGRWLAWDGVRWRVDDTLAAFDLARRACRHAAVGAEQTNRSTKLASAQTVVAIERLARSDRRLAATAAQWDADPWQLNTPGGIVDLRTGDVGPNRPDAFCSKVTAVAPDFGIECPCWEQFLQTVFDADHELIGYVQRVAGYALTGSTREHALFFAYGTGGNGKSVFLNTLAGILGDYAKTAPMSTFTAAATDAHPTDLAMLRGARLVTASETEEGRRWAEARIKALTGGDPIQARFMRQDFFEFVPQFKLLIAGNHRPGLRSIDEAMRRRFHLVPFTVTIPPERRDPDLQAKLKAEWPAILAWAISGCLEWQQGGLQPPGAVRHASEAYLESEDAVAAWLEEETEAEARSWERAGDLYASWRSWADRAGEHPGSQKRLAQALEGRGLIPERRSDGRGYRGVRLRRPVCRDGSGGWQ